MSSENVANTIEQIFKNEIQDKGYETEKFVEFLKSKKGEQGDNYENWTVEEFQQVVQEFHQKDLEPNPQIQAEAQEQIKEPLSESQIAISKILDNSIQSLKSDRIINSVIADFGDEIECLPPDNTELVTIKDLSIKLSFPQKTKKFKKCNMNFLIETSPCNFSVRRSDEDFNWLRKILGLHYPGIFIPPIHTKDLIEDTMDIKIDKEMKNLTYFLSEIIKDPLLKGSKLLYDFLTTETEKEFELKKRAYDKITIPKTVTKLKSRDGFIKLDPTIIEDSKRFESDKKNITNNITIISKLNKKMKEVIDSMRTFGDKLNEMNEIFDELSKETKPYLDYPKSYQIMLSFKNLMKDWAYAQKRQAMSFELDIKQYFKFMKEEYEALNELYDKFEVSKNEYTKNKEKLLKKKEELFKKQDLKKWNLAPEDSNIDKGNKSLCFERMLPQETMNVLEIKKFYYYYGISFESEFNRIRGQIDIQNCELCENVYNKNLAIVKDIYNIWETFRKYEEIEI